MNPANEFLNELSLKMKELNYDLLYIFSSPNDTAGNKIMNDIGAKLVDQKVTYQKDVVKILTPTSGIEEYNSELTSELLELAILSGHKSRFKVDNGLNSKFRMLYKTWIVNSLNRTIADNLFIHKTNNQIDGFITLSKNEDIGRIGLIAVDEKMHGKGIGNLLLKKADEWYIDNNLKSAEVVTQLENKNACSFYEKNNYKISDIQYIYHLWNK